MQPTKVLKCLKVQAKNNPLFIFGNKLKIYIKEWEHKQMLSLPALIGL